jgi:Tfp pilus assembly protein PilF
MMLAVALIAIVLGVGIEAVRLKRLRDQFEARANVHAQLELFYRNAEKSKRESAVQSEADRAATLSLLDMSLQERPSLGKRSGEINKLRVEARDRLKAQTESEKLEAAEAQDQAAKFAYYAAYHDVLKQKYLRASELPWRSVEPDPPPTEPAARGFYWDERGDYQRARTGYEEAVRDEPENAGSLNNLAWSLSTCPNATLRDGKRALELATRACELTKRANSSFLDTLAAAFAESGDFKAAVETQGEAIALLSKGDPSKRAYRDRLEGYKAKKAFRVDGKKGIVTSRSVTMPSLAPRENVFSRIARRLYLACSCAIALCFWSKPPWMIPLTYRVARQRNAT